MALELAVAKTVRSTIAMRNALVAAMGEQLALGVSTRPGYVSAILDSSASLDLALMVLNAHDQLVVLTNKASITADGSDTATITCNDAAIGADASVDYTVWLDGVLYSEGSDTVATGSVVLTLKTNIPGRYLIEVRRQSGNYASGYVEVTAQ